VLINNFL